MKKNLLLVATLCLVAFAQCKKETKTAAEPEPVVVPTPAVFGDGFKIEDNLGGSLVSDSSVCRPNATIHQITSYRGKVAGDAVDNIEITIKNPPLRVKTYPIDSLDLRNCFFVFGGFSSQYKATQGSVTISALSATKMSGTFAFTVTAAVSADTRTLITGTFNNVKVR